MNNLCDYGCGKEAKFQFKNKKYCCNNHVNKCPEVRKNNKGNSGKSHTIQSRNKIRKGHLGKKLSDETKKKLSLKLKGRLVSEETKIKISKSNIGRVSPMFGKKHSEKTKNKMKENQLGEKNSLFGKIYSEEERNQRSRIIKDFMNSSKGEEFKEKQRKIMKNGKAAYMNKFIKNPSKPEIQLRELVKELYPNCEFQYQILNYVVDIALPEHKIAIEYDGWYHFNCKESIEYHNKRQLEIESEGWKFLRYNIYQKFPNEDFVKKEINKFFEDLK